MKTNSQGSIHATAIHRQAASPFSQNIIGGQPSLLGACAGPSTTRKAIASTFEQKSRRITGSTVPKGGGHYKIGRPYQIANKWYKPRENTRYDRVGKASWYGDLFHGRKTANGEVFDMDALTAAHPTLPLPTLVEVTNLPK